MPVGTQATVKAQLTRTLEDAGSQILLANTYHLLLRPGRGVPAHRRHSPFHELEALGADGLRRLPDFLAPAFALDERGGRGLPKLPRRPHDPAQPGAQHRDAERDRQRHHDGARPMHRLDRGRSDGARGAWRSRIAGRRAVSPRAAIRRKRCSRSCRARSFRSCGGRVRSVYARCRSTASRSAASRSAKARASARTSANSPRSCCPTTSRATSWASARRSTFSKPCIAASTCSTASSRRRSRSAARVFTSRGYLQLRRGVYKFSDEKLDPACALPDLRALLARLSPSPHEDAARPSAGSCSASTTSISTTSSCARSAQSILADRFLELYREKRAFLHEADVDNPTFHAEAEARRSGSARWAITRCTSRGRALPASGRFPRAKSCIRARRRWRKRDSFTSSSRNWPSALSLHPRTREPLVIWDVGLGAAANAMAAIRCYEEQATAGPVRPLQIISFENDLDSLRLALRHDDNFPYLRHSGPAGILKDGEWQSKQHAGLELGARCRAISSKRCPPRRAPPDLIFYDMFSSKTSGDQWTLAVFRRLFAACAGRCRRTVYLHLFHREPRGAARRRILRCERAQRWRKAGDHDRAHAGGVSDAIILPA